MQRHRGERGATLILLMGITAALAVLTAASVGVVLAQQNATANDRSDKTALNYAEAALDSAVTAVKNKPMSTTAAFVTESEMEASYVARFASDPTAPPASAVTCRVYDDLATVNTAIAWDQGGPTSATTPDTRVWVEVEVAYQGQKSRLREMVGQTTVSAVSSFPQAAVFSDTNIDTKTGDVYAVNPDGTPDTSGAPFATTIMAGGNLTLSSSTNLAAPGSSVQSLGIQYNGTLTGGSTLTNKVKGGVPPLSSYFDSTTQAEYAAEAKAGSPTQAKTAAQGATVVSSTLLAQLQAKSSVTYNATTDLVVNGNLTLSGGESWFNFKSLYVTGNLTLNGNTHTNTTALYVGGDFTISGPSGTSQFGPIYVGGSVNWGGALSVKTTDYTDATKAPGPMYIVGDFDLNGGPYSDVFGNTWIQGKIPITGHAIDISGNASSILCPIMASTEKITTSGSLNFGTLAQPMILYMVCDNDGYYTNTCSWGSNGTFTGLVVLMEAGMTLPGGNGSQTDFVGAIMSIKDITFGGNTGVCFNPLVFDRLYGTMSSTTTNTTTVPGTWQELSPNAN
jgi:Tfp pilus assembly protein PilX